MTGDEFSRPGSATFHFTFLVLLHSVGGDELTAVPFPSGPRQCAQFPAFAREQKDRQIRAMNAAACRTGRPRLPDRASSKINYGTFIIAAQRIIVHSELLYWASVGGRGHFGGACCGLHRIRTDVCRRSRRFNTRLPTPVVQPPLATSHWMARRTWVRRNGR